MLILKGIKCKKKKEKRRKELLHASVCGLSEFSF